MPKLQLNVDLAGRQIHRNFTSDLFSNIGQAISNNLVGIIDPDDRRTRFDADKISFVFTATDINAVRELIARELALFKIDSFELEELAVQPANHLESRAETKIRIGAWAKELRLRRDQKAAAVDRLQNQLAHVTGLKQSAIYHRSDKASEEAAKRVVNGADIEDVTQWVDVAKLEWQRSTLAHAVILAQAQLQEAEFELRPQTVFHVELPLTAKHVDPAIQMIRLANDFGAVGVGAKISHAIKPDGSRASIDFVSDRPAVSRARLDRALAERSLADSSSVHEFELNA